MRESRTTSLVVTEPHLFQNFECAFGWIVDIPSRLVGPIRMNPENLPRASMVLGTGNATIDSTSKTPSALCEGTAVIVNRLIHIAGSRHSNQSTVERRILS